jgi:hypothetical protein
LVIGRRPLSTIAVSFSSGGMQIRHCSRKWKRRARPLHVSSEANRSGGLESSGGWYGFFAAGPEGAQGPRARDPKGAEAERRRSRTAQKPNGANCANCATAHELNSACLVGPVLSMQQYMLLDCDLLALRCFGSALCGPAHLGSALLGSAPLGSALLGSAMFGLAYGLPAALTSMSFSRSAMRSHVHSL